MISSLLGARAFIANVATQTGMIIGPNIDVTSMQKLFLDLVGSAVLPQTSESDTLKDVLQVREYVYNQLVTLNLNAGIAVTAANADALTDWIVGASGLPESSDPS